MPDRSVLQAVIAPFSDGGQIGLGNSTRELLQRMHLVSGPQNRYNPATMVTSPVIEGGAQLGDIILRSILGGLGGGAQAVSNAADASGLTDLVGGEHGTLARDLMAMPEASAGSIVGSLRRMGTGQRLGAARAQGPDLARRFMRDESGSLNLPPSGGGGGLDMSDAARMQRAKELGYDDMTFYRGEKSGKDVDKFNSGGYFSRENETADGFARQGGKERAPEYRLNLDSALTDRRGMNLGQYARIVESAMTRDPKLAVDLAEQIAPGRGAEWLIGFAKKEPGMEVVERGMVKAVQQALEKSADPIGILKGAGIDAIDIGGRDVRKIAGTGIRSSGAAFDPAKKDLIDLMAGIGGISVLPAIIGQSETGGGF